jgi:hypothetical protein
MIAVVLGSRFLGAVFIARHEQELEHKQIALSARAED